MSNICPYLFNRSIQFLVITHKGFKMGVGNYKQLPIFNASDTLRARYPEHDIKSHLLPPRWGLFKSPGFRAYLVFGRVSFGFFSILVLILQYCLYPVWLPIGLILRLCFPDRYDFLPRLRRSHFRDVALAVGLPLTIFLHKYTPRRLLRLLWDIFWCHYFIFGSGGEENSQFFVHDLFWVWTPYLEFLSPPNSAQIPFFIIAFDDELIADIPCLKTWDDKEFLEHVLGVYTFLKLERGLLSSLSLQRLGRIEVAEVSLPSSTLMSPHRCDCVYCIRTIE